MHRASTRRRRTRPGRSLSVASRSMLTATRSRSEMPTFEHVGRNGRVYRRSFDYAEAALLREQGLTFAEIGARFGVSGNTIERAVKPPRQARQLENSKRWRTGICEGCGGPAMRLVRGKREHNPDGRVLCIS